MDLLAPAALWWLLALGVLLLIPRIRLPRSRRLAAALHFWMPSDADERPRPVVRLRRHRSLILQALAIVALVGALTKPILFWHGRTLAIVVDVSASMAAVEGNRTRLGLARDAALAQVAALPLGSRVRLISAGETVEFHGEFGASGTAVRAALDRLTPQPSGALLADAIDTAKAIADADVLVVTDAPSTDDGRVQWVQVGSTVRNVALTALAARRLVDSPLDAELIAELSNYSDTALSVPLVISGPAGTIHASDVPLREWESRVVTVPIPAATGTYSARIGHDDALAADNVAATTLPGVVARVALTGRPSAFTRTALAVNPAVTIVDDPAQANLVVCGGCDLVPNVAANVLITRAAGVPRLDRRHPVAAAAAPLALEGVARIEATRRVLRLGVDDEDVRIVRDAAFPLLMAASVEWLVNAPSEGGTQTLLAGESDLRIVKAPPSRTTASSRGEKASPLALTTACLVGALLFVALDWFWLGGRAATPAVLVLRGLIVVALVASIFGVRLPWGEGRAAVVFALDRSQSIGPSAEAAAARTIEQQASRMRTGDRAGVVVFGADAVVDQPLSEASPRSRPDSDVARGGTDVERAIRVARTTLPPDGLRRIVLLSDGHATSGDAAREIAAANRDGVGVDVVPLRQRRTATARVHAVHAPAQVTAGERFDVALIVSGAPGERVAVSLMRDARTIHSSTTTLDARGDSLVTVSERVADSGVVTYTATTEGRDAADAGTAVTVAVFRRCFT
jgi:hypothetical protein